MTYDGSSNSSYYFMNIIFKNILIFDGFKYMFIYLHDYYNGILSINVIVPASNFVVDLDDK